jgi:electron transport complex protein RnfG
MGDMLKMILVLTAITVFSGSMLAFVESGTEARIENQVLEFVKGPAIKSIMEKATNDPIKDRFQMQDGETERTFFVGVIDGQPRGVAFETTGKGYGGDVGLMVGIDSASGKLLGVGVTTHAETPGMGAKAKSDPAFVAQFKGMPVQEKYQVTQDGGSISAISGATITSRAVSAAASEATGIYRKLEPELAAKMKAFGK